MKRFFVASGLFAAFLFGDWQATIDPSAIGGSFVRPAAAYDDDAYHDFDQALRPYGQWVVSPQWGHVWIPAGRPQGWRPYSDGHWDYTDDYGWVWVSDQEWGWAPFHYGRWAADPQFGWVWIPGRVWGPAWVSFRYGGDYVGWAPLPPDGGNYDEVPSYGYEPSINVSFWNFVPRQHFNDRNVNRYYDYRGNDNYYHQTKNVTNITIVNNRVVNNSINVNQFENDTRQRVVRHRVDVTDQVVPGNQRNRGNDLVIVRPKDVERNAGTPRMRGGAQQTGNQNGGNQGNQNGNHGKPNQPIVTSGKPNQQGPVQTEILPPAGKPDKHQGNDNRTVGSGNGNDQGKPNGNRPVQAVLPPPGGKPRGGAGPANVQGGSAQNLRQNDHSTGNANGSGVGHAKPAPVIIPPPDNGNNKHSMNNGNNGRNNDHSQANNGRNRPQQEAAQGQNNGQGRQPPPAGNNPPAHAPKKGSGNDCGQGNKGCTN